MNRFSSGGIVPSGGKFVDYYSKYMEEKNRKLSRELDIFLKKEGVSNAKRYTSREKKKQSKKEKKPQEE